MRGFTFIELLIVIVIISILASVVLAGFYNYRLHRTLELSAKEVRQILEEARSRTLAAVNDSSYGVEIGSSEITLFAGEEYYSDESSNETFTIDQRVIISEISFDPPSSTVLFKRATGESSVEGFIELSLINKPESKKRITVSKQGIISSNE